MTAGIECKQNDHPLEENEHALNTFTLCIPLRLFQSHNQTDYPIIRKIKSSCTLDYSTGSCDLVPPSIKEIWRWLHPAVVMATCSGPLLYSDWKVLSLHLHTMQARSTTVHYLRVTPHFQHGGTSIHQIVLLCRLSPVGLWLPSSALRFSSTKRGTPLPLVVLLLPLKLNVISSSACCENTSTSCIEVGSEVTV